MSTPETESKRPRTALRSIIELLSAQLNDTKEALEKQTVYTGTVCDKLAAVSAERDQLRARVQDLESELSFLRLRVSELEESELASLNDRPAVELDSIKAEVSGDAIRPASETASLRSRVAELEKSVSDIVKECQCLRIEARLHTCHQEKWLAQIQALKETRSELWRERDSLRSALAQAEARIKELEQKP